MKLENKVVLVTGASKGIGRAIALGMAQQGADVVVNYNTDRQSADAVAAKISQLGQRSLAVHANVGVVSDVRRMFQRISTEFQQLDVLINNAAITGWGSLITTTEEKWDEVINTNLKGTFFCSQEAVRMMKEAGQGAIVNVSTVCTKMGVFNLVAYVASKGGIEAITKQMAVELAPFNIRVNTFAPGATIVDRNLKDDPHYNETWSPLVPLGRAAAAEEMVGPAVFLASDDSAYMTGQVFFVDGGWSSIGKLPNDYFDKAMNKHT